MFAFVKVAQPEDIFGSPSFLLSVRTADGDRTEPITALQTLFDIENDCQNLGINNLNESKFSLYPNPSNNKITITLNNDSLEKYNIELFSITGKAIYRSNFIGETEINIAPLSRGVYFIKVTNNGKSSVVKWIKN